MGIKAVYDHIGLLPFPAKYFQFKVIQLILLIQDIQRIWRAGYKS